MAVVDVTSQAYGRREEAYGIHLALAAAAGAYAEARLAGHPVIGLIVGKAMSGAFLAHGYQANRLIALSDPKVMVHAMGKASAARVTLRTVEDLEAFAARIPPMAYDIDSYASLGLLWRCLALQAPRRRIRRRSRRGARSRWPMRSKTYVPTESRPHGSPRRGAPAGLEAGARQAARRMVRPAASAT